MEQDSDDYISTDFYELLQHSVWVSSPEYAGWLQKRSNHWLLSKACEWAHKDWPKKWVSLHGLELVYMDCEPTLENISKIKIRKFLISGNTAINEQCSEIDDQLAFSISFLVTTGGKYNAVELHFKATNLEEKRDWIMKLTQVHAIAEWLELYEKVKVLGLGAQGVVYELKHKCTGERVALKEIEIKSDKQMAMALAEAQFLKNIVDNVAHPNIMQIEKVFQVGSKFYLVFPLCTGGELFDAIASRGHFTEYDAAVIMHELVGALHALHEHDILHLDIKPENILFESTEPNSKILLTDFGLSQLFSEIQKTQEKSRPFREIYQERLELFMDTGELVYDESLRGSNGYMSPEMILAGYYSKAADVFAAGVVLYILLCGHPPFYAKSMRITFLRTIKGIYKLDGHEWEHISSDAKDLIKQMLEIDPEKRITTDAILHHPWILQVANNTTILSIATASKKNVNKNLTSKAITHTTTNYDSMKLYDELLKTSDVDDDADGNSVIISDSEDVDEKQDETFMEDDIIKRVPSSGHYGTNLCNALARLADHIKLLKSDKLANVVAAFLSLSSSNGGSSEVKDSSRLAALYLVGNNSSNFTEEELAQKAQIATDHEIELHSFDGELRRALTVAIFHHFGANTDKFTIEQFIHVQRQLGILSPLFKSNSTEISIGDIVLVKMMDQDHDGYLSLQDILTAQILISRRDDTFLHAVFRYYCEAIWYPGKKLNEHHVMKSMKLHYSQKDAKSSISEFDEEKLEVVEPPKYITAKNVGLIFERFGYDSKNGIKVFKVLCEVLRRLDHEKSSGATELQQEQSSEKKKLRFFADDHSQKTRMDEQDFIRAAKLDDVLIQVLLRPSNEALYELLKKGKARLNIEQEEQNSLPTSERKDINTEKIFEHLLSELFIDSTRK